MYAQSTKTSSDVLAQPVPPLPGPKTRYLQSGSHCEGTVAALGRVEVGGAPGPCALKEKCVGESENDDDEADDGQDEGKDEDEDEGENAESGDDGGAVGCCL